jgi:DNA invertase Pin-like site-specific DNA recombinase
MTRVCLYTRISTDEENQPTSLHSQRERLEAFCAAQEGWRIVAHEEDRSTGAKLDRPGLTQALELARTGKTDLLLVYRVDRLSRKVRQLAQLAEELDSYDVVLRSATEPFDTGSAAGRMMLQMLGVFAEFEHATIVDRVSAGIERRAKEGKWATGRLPFGYRRNDRKELIPDERTVPTIKRIFELYTAGRLGTAAIARRLADEQAAAPPAGWQPAVVQLVLQNEAYLGRVLWRGQSLPGLHEPLSMSSPSSARNDCCVNAAKTWRYAAATRATTSSPDSSAAAAAAVPTSAQAPAATAASTTTTPAPADKNSAAKPATANASPATNSKPLSSSNSPPSTATAALSAKRSMRQERRPKKRDHHSSKSAAPSPTRPAAGNGHWLVTTPPSKPATSMPPASKRACPPSRRASTPSANKTPSSPNNSPHKPRRRPTRPNSPPSPTTSKPQSPPPSPDRRKRSSDC